MSDFAPAPGGTRRETARAELAFWESHLADWDRHLATYQRSFPFGQIDYDNIQVLDVGCGPISIFESVAPAGARIVPYDPLATEYNRIAVRKRFPIVGHLPSDYFGLVTLFNCLDHMDRPGELLERLVPLVDINGRVWICCHINRPFGIDEHPQDFRFWHLVVMTDGMFQLRRCGLTREGPLFPYVWWGICSRRSRRPGVLDWPGRVFFVVSCGVQFARFHLVRAVIKAMKLVGLRRLLPPVLRF